MSDPWMKFYTSDWRADPQLRMCSMAARGLWVEMICLMHEAHPYGHLLVNGQALTDTQLGALVGASPEQIAALLGELETAGVFSRTRAGVIYSRKLSRMAKKAATARNNGRKGGNPSITKQRENSASVKGQVKYGVKPQKPEPEPDNTLLADANNDGGAVDATVEEIWQRGVPYLTARGVPDRQARSTIGKWIRDHGATRLHEAMRAASDAGTHDPIPYITRFLQPKPDAVAGALDWLVLQGSKQ